MNTNLIFQNTLSQASLPSLKFQCDNSDVPNHWLEEKSLAQKNEFVAQKYNDPKIVACLSKIRALLGEYTFSEPLMIKEILEAEYDIQKAINYLLGERIIIKNRGKRKMMFEETPNGKRFVRDDLTTLPDEKTLNKLYKDSLLRFPNIICPLDDSAIHVQDYVQDSMKYYQSVGFGVRQKNKKDKTKDPEKKKKKNV